MKPINGAKVCFSRYIFFFFDPSFSDPQILFGSLFPKPFPTKDFVKKARIIRLFVTGPKQQKVVLFCVEKLCQMDSSAVALLPSILNCFWEESVIDEEVVYKWFKHPNKHLPPKLSAKVRQESDVFVKWLEYFLALFV